MKTLILIRHTETNHLAELPCSELPNDSVLSDSGRAHAERILERLSSYKVDLVVSSLYLRSQQTAEILNAGWRAKSISAMALNEYFLREDGAGVESVEQAFVRMSQFMDPYRLVFENIAVISHRSVLATYMSGLFNLPFCKSKDLFTEPGSINVLGRDWERGEEQWGLRESISSL